MEGDNWNIVIIPTVVGEGETHKLTISTPGLDRREASTLLADALLGLAGDEAVTHLIAALEAKRGQHEH